MTRDELLDEVQAVRTEHPDMRYGQALFNTAYRHLSEDRVEAAAEVADPFYLDMNAPAFLDALFPEGGLTMSELEPHELPEDLVITAELALAEDCQELNATRDES